MAEHPYPPNLTQIGGDCVYLGRFAALSLAGELFDPAQPLAPGLSQIRQVVKGCAVVLEFFQMMLYIGILTGADLVSLIVDNIDVIREELVHGFIEILKLSDLRLRIAHLLRQTGVGLRVVLPGALERGL
jgi:hypothetical protein